MFQDGIMSARRPFSRPAPLRGRVRRLAGALLLTATGLTSAAVFGGLGGVASASTPITVAFSYTGASQTWTVPAGVVAITVDMAGAPGGAGSSANAEPTTPGAARARVQGTVSVTPGATETIIVGCVGANGSTGGSASGGYGGGGAGGFPGAGPGGGGGGGGMSAVENSDGAVLAAAAAGGGGRAAGQNGGYYGGSGGSPGSGGVSTGGGATAGGSAYGYGGGGGGGASTSSGGQGASYQGAGAAGALSSGGAGGNAAATWAGGGGGGGGGYYGAIGGGGSSDNTGPGYEAGGGGASLVPSGGGLARHVERTNTGWEDVLIPLGMAAVGNVYADEELLSWARNWSHFHLAVPIRNASSGAPTDAQAAVSPSGWVASSYS